METLSFIMGYTFAVVWLYFLFRKDNKNNIQQEEKKLIIPIISLPVKPTAIEANKSMCKVRSDWELTREQCKEYIDKAYNKINKEIKDGGNIAEVRFLTYDSLYRGWAEPSRVISRKSISWVIKRVTDELVKNGYGVSVSEFGNRCFSYMHHQDEGYAIKITWPDDCEEKL
jgi:nucleoid DNA-binding protein